MHARSRYVNCEPCRRAARTSSRITVPTALASSTANWRPLYFGPMTVSCPDCGDLFWADEVAIQGGQSFSKCCLNGSLRLDYDPLQSPLRSCVISLGQTQVQRSGYLHSLSICDSLLMGLAVGLSESMRAFSILLLPMSLLAAVRIPAYPRTLLPTFFKFRVPCIICLARLQVISINMLRSFSSIHLIKVEMS